MTTLPERPRYYRLTKAHTTIPCTLEEWSKYMETGDRRVDHTILGDGRRISTVFLGLDHQYGNGPPLLFETMVFDAADKTEYMQRYTTWKQAMRGHEEVVEELTDEHA